MQNKKYQIDIPKIKGLLELQPKKLDEVKTALDFDKFKTSRFLNEKRKLEAGEFLTISKILNVEPFDLAK